MSKPSQKAQYEQLKQATDPAARRDLALDLLDATRSRDYVDAALAALRREDVIDLLGDVHRPILRDKVFYYFENEDRDQGGLIREQIVRLLMAIGHPGDMDVYTQGAVTYHRQPVRDSAQNLRAASLVAMVALDQAWGCAYATRLLGEPDTSVLNGEPSLAALKVLAGCGQYLPVYLFALRQGEAFIERGNAEVVGQALEALADEAFPRHLFAELIKHFIALDVPVVSSSIAAAITAHRLDSFYRLLDHMIAYTRHPELVRYILIVMAGARDDTLTAMLYDLARECPPAQAMDYLEAVELTSGDGRDEVIALLERRL
jgi:hypothetical protein